MRIILETPHFLLHNTVDTVGPMAGTTSKHADVSPHRTVLRSVGG